LRSPGLANDLPRDFGSAQRQDDSISVPGKRRSKVWVGPARRSTKPFPPINMQADPCAAGLGDQGQGAVDAVHVGIHAATSPAGRAARICGGIDFLPERPAAPTARR
jgi:hypothetical protein